MLLAFFINTGLAQSFKQAGSNVSGAGIKLGAGTGTTVPITIELWTNLPDIPGAAMLASGTEDGTGGSYVDIFWSPVAVTPGATYYLHFVGSLLAINGDTQNGYADGQAYANAGFESFPSFDYTFCTYTNAVPEPSNWALLIAGFGLTGAAMRRRRVFAA